MELSLLKPSWLSLLVSKKYLAQEKEKKVAGLKEGDIFWSSPSPYCLRGEGDFPIQIAGLYKVPYSGGGGGDTSPFGKLLKRGGKKERKRGEKGRKRVGESREKAKRKEKKRKWTKMVWMGRKMEMGSKKKYSVVKIWKDFQIGLEKVFKIDGTVCSDIPMTQLFFCLNIYPWLKDVVGGLEELATSCDVDMFACLDNLIPKIIATTQLHNIIR